VHYCLKCNLRESLKLLLTVLNKSTKESLKIHMEMIQDHASCEQAPSSIISPLQLDNLKVVGDWHGLTAVHVQYSPM